MYVRADRITAATIERIIAVGLIFMVIIVLDNLSIGNLFFEFVDLVVVKAVEVGYFVPDGVAYLLGYFFQGVASG